MLELEPLGAKDVKTIPHQKNGLFSLSKSAVRAGWSLAVPSRLQDEHFSSSMSTVTSSFGSAMTTLGKVER